MSGRERVIERALARLAAPDARLAPAAAGFGVFVSEDRRRRPLVKLSADEVRILEAEGAIVAGEEDAFVLSAAGRARVRRDDAEADEAFLAQHAVLERRAVMQRDGVTRQVRSADGGAAMKRLAQLRDANGAPWLSAGEISAASLLLDDWRRGQIGLIRGSDWSAPPRSGAGRRPSNAREAALERHCDARQRVDAGLSALAPALRRVVEQVCLHEDGLEALERREGWPARSGKIALKLGLAQLASAPPYGR